MDRRTFVTLVAGTCLLDRHTDADHNRKPPKIGDRCDADHGRIWLSDHSARCEQHGVPAQ